MPHLLKRVSDLKEIGPTIDITIYPPAGIITVSDIATASPPMVNVTGLIDSGASISAIDNSIVKKLSLISRDRISVLTPSGLSYHFTYDIGLQLPKEMESKTYFIEVTGCDLTLQPYDLLIGRDILQYCTMIFNGWDNSFQLHI